MANAADNFNRSNRTLDGDTASDGIHVWSDKGGGWNILSNQADTGAGTTNHMVINPGCSDADIGVTIAAIVGTTTGEGVVFRWGATTDYWFAWLSTTTLGLSKRVAGTPALVTSAAISGGAGDSIRVHAVGDQISVYHTPSGGAESLVLGPVTDSFNQTETEHGCWNAGGSSVKLDNFVLTDLTAGGGTNPKGPLSNPFAGPFGGPI